MDRERAAESLMNAMNVLILLVIALIYTVTGTPVGEDAIKALSNGAIYRGGENGSVAIECIVGWNAAALPDMLDVLARNDTQITFFVSGKWAGNHAPMLKRMAEDGHEVGTIGYSPLLDGDAAMVAKDIAAAAGIIEGITGKKVRYYHPGMRDGSVSGRASEELELFQISATADLLCARGEPEDIVERASSQAFDGSILLIQPTAAALEALPSLLAVIRDMGCRPGTVGSVMKGAA